MNKNSVNNVKHDLLMQSLENFYKDSENLKILTSIINGESKISLRVIDWFVTNYSKKNNISYLILDDRQLDINKPEMKEFVVYID